jgi:hypothetical protein
MLKEAEPQSLPNLARSEPTDSYRLLNIPIPYRRERLQSEQATLEEYVTCTDQVIGLLDGTIQPEGKIREVDRSSLLENGRVRFEVSDVEEVDDLSRPDVVVWLDKSARPVSWMVREFWDQLAAKDDVGNPVHPPRSIFLNIDREPWLYRTGISSDEIDADREDQFDINKIGRESESAKQILGRIRGLFVEPARTETTDDGREEVIRLTPENFDEEVWRMPIKKRKDESDHAHMMIIDEVKSSGATARISQELLSAALPEIKVTIGYWQNKRSAKHIPSLGRGWVPIWYSSEELTGRGIGGVDEARYKKSSVNWIHKLGSIVLSTPKIVDKATGQKVDDRKSGQLRNEIKLLGRQLRSHEVLYVPHRSRGGDFVKRIEEVNDITLAEWQARRGISR